MHLVHSAYRPDYAPATSVTCIKTNRQQTGKKHNQLRYQGYQAACYKYRHEIAAIRQYLPGWQPEFLQEPYLSNI